MRAYKFTAGDAVNAFTRFPWPIPAAGNPDAWVDASDGVAGVRGGVHACHAGDLPYWLGRELWEVELASDVVEAPYKLVAPPASSTAELAAIAERASAKAPTLLAALAGYALDCVLEHRYGLLRHVRLRSGDRLWQLAVVGVVVGHRT
jgi:hypothetical protein